MRKLDRILVVLGMLVLVWSVWWWMVQRPFRYRSVCSRCGLERFTTDWALPATDYRLFSRSSEIPTPLSQVLTTNGIVSAHRHDWLFCNGSGNGVKCAIGSGRQFRNSAQSPEFASLIGLLHRHGESKFLQLLLHRAHGAEGNRFYLYQPDWNDLPANPNTSEVRAWVAEQLRLIDLLERDP